jgi:hypothetical protein
MFIDSPFLSQLAEQRHRELVAEAEQYRLGRLARAARRVRPPARSRPERAPRAPEPAALRGSAEDRRRLVPR